MRGNTTTNRTSIIQPNLTDAETASGVNNYFTFANNTAIIDNSFWSGYGLSPVYWNFRRAPGFFDEVCYTGTGSNTTVPHNLGVAPELVIIKARSFGQVWVVGTTAIGFGNYLVLNTTAATASGSNVFNSTAPTSTVFSLGDGAGGNQSSATYVAYCFAPIAGYSAFGSYTGNASTDGPFVHLGFRPEFVMIKRSDSTDGGEWKMHDTIRTPFNWTCNVLFAQTSDAENTTENQATYGVDMVSNGFKIRASHSSHNASGGTYIYMAFASNPFKYSLAR